MKIQIIGLPGSGKTTLIKKYLERRKSNLDKPDPLNIKYYSLGADGGQNKAEKIMRYAHRTIILETACGVAYTNSEIIKLEIPTKRRREQYLRRENLKEFTEKMIQYESLLESQMLPAKYTVSTEEAFFNILDKLLSKASPSIQAPPISTKEKREVIK
tara:strand:- start:298 stop:771 length:474 start_codon:yes stop_codon:yes gene_type:complete